MKKIININFHSRVVPIEETAYEILQQYIDSLRRHFANEEGRDEIISDIENRFSELFAESLKKGSTCITDTDVEAIITSMGRPEDLGDAEMSGAPPNGSSNTGAGQDSFRSQEQSFQYASHEPRRLYRSENEKLLGGVCAGIANYLGLDPSIARIIFVLMILAWGTGILVYIILWIVLPKKPLLANIRKRLYRNPDDRIIAGVSSGLAAYLHIEVWIPRLIFSLPLILSIFTSFLHHAWFHVGRSVFVTGGFGGTLFITYIILWIILPEATSASEKLEMRGEKVDLESIKNTVRNDLGSFKGRAREMGREMQDQFQKAGQQMRQHAQTFTTEAAPVVRRTGSGIGHAIGVLFKAFFLLIAAVIVFALISALVALLFRGNGIITIKNYLITGVGQNFLVWAGFFLFLVIPVIALLTWLIRRITGRRSRNHYLGYAFATLWIIGLFCLIGLAVTVMNNFRSRQHVEENIDLAQPSHGKLIVMTTEEKNSYGDDENWLYDFNWDSDGPFFNLNEDSLLLNTVRLNLDKSDDSSYHVKIVKFGHGSNGEEARRVASQIAFSPQQADSVLSLPYAFSISRDQKFRNQQVLVIVSVPVGKRILVNNTVNHYNWFNINLNNRRVRWTRHGNDDWGWEQDADLNGRYPWNSNVEYMMTANGLTRTGRQRTNEKDHGRENEEKKPKDSPVQENGRGGYRYKHQAGKAPASPAEEKKPPVRKDSSDTKRTARQQTGPDPGTYFLSALLFQ